MSQRPYLILDCYFDELGAAPNFRALLGEAPSVTVRAVFEALPGDLTVFAGVLITGSKANWPAPEPWMLRLLKLLAKVRAHGLPMLGICFGHQAIATAVAGSDAVRVAPRGELGWLPIEIIEPNPILEGLPAEFSCFVSHFDEVAPNLPGLEVFARSQRCAVQGFQVSGELTWGLQFHPEMDPAESEALVRNNAERHVSQSEDAEGLLAQRLDGRYLGKVVLRNFMGICDRQAGVRANLS